MDASHREILRKLHVELRESLSADTDLLEYLYGQRILSRDDVNEISLTEAGTKRPAKQRADALLQLIPGRGRTALHKFCEALRDSDLSCNKDLGVMLESAAFVELSAARITTVQDGGNSAPTAPVVSSVHPVQVSGTPGPACCTQTAGIGTSGGAVNPWEHPDFAPLYAWLVKYLYPAATRTSCIEHGLIAFTALGELQAKEQTSQTAHNEFLLQQAAVGGRESFHKLDAVLKDLGANYEMKRQELAQLAHRL